MMLVDMGTITNGALTVDCLLSMNLEEIFYIADELKKRESQNG